MKFTNLSKLLIKFIGGGLVNFPTRYLKEVEVEAEGGESDGGESENNDELLLKTKQLISDYVTRRTGSGTTEYNIELPDAYIVFDGNNGVLYDCTLEAICTIRDYSIFPLYLKSRNITENSAIFADNVTPLPVSNAAHQDLDTYINDEFQNTTINITSININDYIVFLDNGEN